jgi:hypothetical protein
MLKKRLEVGIPEYVSYDESEEALIIKTNGELGVITLTATCPKVSITISDLEMALQQIKQFQQENILTLPQKDDTIQEQEK